MIEVRLYTRLHPHLRPLRRTPRGTPRRTPAVLAGLAALVSTACGAGGPGASAPVVRDSAGITIVENTAPQWRETEAWRVAAEPEVDIGVLEGDEAYQLHQVRNALRLSDGRIVVANGTHDVRYYDASGRHLLTVGRQGGGPGEFQWIGRVFRLPGDSVGAADWGLGRVTILDSEGQLARLIDADAPLGILGDGTYVRSRNERSRGRREPGMRRDPVYLVRYTPGESTEDTIAKLPGSEYYVDVQESGNNVMIFNRGAPFGRMRQSIVAADRIYTGAGDAWEISVYAPDGTLERLIRIDRPNRAVTTAEIDAFGNQLLARASDDNERRRLERYLAEAAFPETMPAYSEIMVDADGHLWVRRYPAPSEQGAAPVWDVLDADGRWLGTVETPAGLRIHEVGTDYVLGVWRDELDVEHVRLHRLDRGEGG